MFDKLKIMFGRENYYFAISLAFIFYLVYWFNQVGAISLLFIIIPQISTVTQVVTYSVILYVILPLLYCIFYYIEVIFFKTIKIKKVSLWIYRLIIAIAILSSFIFTKYNVLLLTICIIFLVLCGELVIRKNKIKIKQTLLRTDGDLNLSAILTVIFIVGILSIVSGNYVQQHYKASTLNQPDAEWTYLGSISDNFVVKREDMLMISSNILLKKVK